MPCNRDIQELILNKSHLKADYDEARYEVILRHFVIWSNLESALENGSIVDYDASHILSFPDEEVRKHHLACDQLLDERDELLKRMQTVAWTAYRSRYHRNGKKGEPT